MAQSALLHYLKYVMGVEKANTQTSANEREAIKQYAGRANKAAEIGVFEGVNTVTIASAMQGPGILYAIDPFFRGRLGFCYYQKIAMLNLKRSNVSGKVKILPMYSQDAVNKIHDELDFIFIDGDHSVEGITRDWKDWSSKLEPGGIIALHDTSIPEYNAAVKNLGSYQYFQSHIRHDPRFSLIETVDSLNILRKN